MIKKLYVCKAGGGAGKNTKKWRAELPASAIQLMGITEEDREVNIEVVQDKKDVYVKISKYKGENKNG